MIDCVIRGHLRTTKNFEPEVAGPCPEKWSKAFNMVM